MNVVGNICFGFQAGGIITNALVGCKKLMTPLNPEYQFRLQRRFLERRNTIKVGKGDIRKDLEKARNSRVERYR
jgi:hypothetical protein